MKIADGESILFIGDSITDCGREHPVGRGDGLGTGYVSFVASMFAASRPECRIEVLNTGIDGDNIIDLEARWQRDVLDLQVDWLSVMIGINDVWRQFNSPPGPHQVMIQRYEAVYRKLLEQTRPTLGGMVLMTPYVIESDQADPMRQRMDEYGKVVERLATEFDAVFVDLQAGFDQYLEYRPAESLCEDRVHPNQIGHMIIAKTFLTAMGFCW